MRRWLFLRRPASADARDAAWGLASRKGGTRLVSGGHRGGMHEKPTNGQQDEQVTVRKRGRCTRGSRYVTPEEEGHVPMPAKLHR
jgi:hypothetical protein